MKKNKIISIVFASTLLFLTIFRFLQIVFFVDPLTGFTKSPIFDWVLYLPLLLFFVFSIVFIYYDKKIEQPEETVPFKLPIDKIVIIIYSFLLLVFSFMQFKGIHFEFNVAQRNPNLMISLIFTVVTSVIGILTGILFNVSVLKAIYKRESIRFGFIAYLFMIIHTILILLTYFTKERTLVTISQNLLTLIFWMSALKFVYSYSKLQCNSKIGNPFIETYVFSMLTTVIGAVTIIPILVSTQNYYVLLRSEYILMVPIFLLSFTVSFGTTKTMFLKN